MTLLNRKLRYPKRLLWMLLAVVVASAAWILKVELAYQRNVRHIPTDFRVRQHVRIYNWKT
jgi:hypothetical protein